MADAYLADLLADFPAVMITGPAWRGKTTTAAKHVAQVVRLDEPGVAATYRADPDAARPRTDRPVLSTSGRKSPRCSPPSSGPWTVTPCQGPVLLTGSVRAAAGQRDLGRYRAGGPHEHVPRRPNASGDTFARPALVPLPPSQLRRRGSRPCRLTRRRSTVISAMALSGGFPELAYRQRSASGQGPRGWQATSTTSSPGMLPPLTAPRTLSSCVGM